MSNYIELSPQIMAHESWITDSTEVNATLEWLDDHPDQAPGRTITASEFDEAVESCITEDATVPPHKFAERLGVVCVPDPEPTDAEKATADLETWGISRAGALELGPWLAGQGWVKAPGEFDE